MSSKSFGKKVSRFLGNLTVSTIHLILRLIIITLGAAFLLGLAVFSWAFYHISIPERVEGADAERTSVYWDDGTTLIGTYSGDNRIIIECVDLPKSEVQNESNNLDVKKQNYVANAIVASEDRTFYDNKGIDPMGIARALRNNLLEGTRQGGSTITQQYAERYFLGNALNYQDKIKEGIIALKLSISQDKDVVLCNYMNTIFFGKTSYGIEAAARSYYGVSANELSISQAALIAGIIPSPSKWDPDLSVDSEKWAKERWKRTLDLMLEDGHITKEEYNVATSEFPYTIQGFRKNAETAQANAVNAAALAAQLATGADAEGNPVTAEEIAKAAEDSAKLANIAAYAVEQAAKSDASITQENEKTSWEGFNGYVMAQVKTEIEENERFAKQGIESAGLKITTTLNQEKQGFVNEAMATIPRHDERLRFTGIALDTATSGILGWYPGDDYLTQAFNNSTQAKFQAGSTMKAFCGAAAAELDAGLYKKTFNGQSPQSFAGLGRPVNNVGKTSYGQVTIQTMFNNSINTAFVALNSQIGPEKTASAALRAGNIVIDEFAINNVLGYNQVTAMNLANGYATFANSGKYNKAHIVASAVKISDGSPQYHANIENKQVFKQSANALLVAALHSNTKAGGNSKASSYLGAYQGAVKSGTSSDTKSVVLAGFIPQVSFVAAAWQTGPNGEEQEISQNSGQFKYGSNWPLTAWGTFMQKAKDTYPVVELPMN